ncbi:MAG TPA: hypothetical protein PLP19_01050 [bacterium]|nr:hypothetical protein [bacterium]HPN42050.1 hypothetical protein [bacterium]
MVAFFAALFPLGALEIMIILLVIFFPPILVLVSKRANGSKKYGWLLITLFLSWLGYLLFLLITNKPVENGNANLPEK